MPSPHFADEPVGQLGALLGLCMQLPAEFLYVPFGQLAASARGIDVIVLIDIRMTASSESCLFFMVGIEIAYANSAE